MRVESCLVRESDGEKGFVELDTTSSGPLRCRSLRRGSVICSEHKESNSHSQQMSSTWLVVDYAAKMRVVTIVVVEQKLTVILGLPIWMMQPPHRITLQ